MKHLILGAGNLGKDLLIELNAKNPEGVTILSASRGTDFLEMEDLVRKIDEYKPDVVWCAVGGGSVADCKPGSPKEKQSLAINLSRPLYLAKRLDSKIHLVVFSTDYAADPSRPRATFAQGKPLSQYAWQKQTMENELKSYGRPLTTIIRVGSLYGTHKPEKTFPGKLLANFGGESCPTIISLPSNIVVPTPTRWLAHRIVFDLEAIRADALFGVSVLHAAPSGGVTVKDWGKMVLGHVRTEKDFARGKDYFDDERPILSGLGCSFGPTAHWHELWKIYFRPEWYAPKLSRSGIKADVSP